MNADKYILLAYHPDEYVLDIIRPSEGNKLLHGIVIGQRPFIVAFEYNTGENKERDTEVCFETYESLENIGSIPQINRFGLEISVNDGRVYFNGEEITKFIEKHKLENLVKGKT